MATLLPLPSDLLEQDGFASDPASTEGVPDLSSFCGIWAPRGAAGKRDGRDEQHEHRADGCGRKAGLDAPPMAAPAPPPAAPDGQPMAPPPPPR